MVIKKINVNEIPRIRLSDMKAWFDDSKNQDEHMQEEMYYTRW